jgi:TolA-binding protein
LDNALTIRIKKAGISTCLFLWVLGTDAQQRIGWLGREEHQAAYYQALNLEMDNARKSLHDSADPESIYIASLCDAIELLITEDESKFDRYEEENEKRQQQLNRINPKTPEVLFASAELRLQWSFVYLKFGHEFDAAWNIRQSYNLTQECKSKYSRFTPIRKTSGLLHIMLGSVPEKYQWVLSMLAMRGSVEKGLDELQALRTENNPLAAEASLLLFLAQGLILQQPQAALDGLSQLPASQQNKLSLFLAAVLAIKNSESEKALSFLNTLKSNSGGLSIPYADYLLGEVYLHKGEYTSAIDSYQEFRQHYTGKNFIKDSFYKIAICHWLMGNTEMADRFARAARTSGSEYAEADRYAAQSLLEKELPNRVLTTLRYATDGGYYEKATRLIDTVDADEFRTHKEQTEFVYRKARLYHKLNQVEKSEQLYMKTISLTGDNSWYFAPNACLQLGYLYMAAGNNKQAAVYFRKAISYKKHEYKNSIDTKAKSALDQLRKQQ